jgi:uncharacterized protein (DUF1800 family)
MSTLTRRDFLRLSGLVAAGAAVAACGPLQALEARPVAGWEELAPADFHALNRMTFGARRADRARAAEIGLQAWVEEQLAPEGIDDLACGLRLRNLDTLGMDGQQLFDRCDKIFDDVDRETAPAQLRQGALLRQVYSRRQLYEVLVEFWNDHFSIASSKGECYYLKTVDDREVIRAHALSSFRDLLWASAHSPAMLTYLDNQANHRGAPNENYARELLELHTLGVSGGYEQRDVMELARCLTGWGVKEHFWRGEFSFNPDQHDPGEKFVLGERIPGGGQVEAESVVERLARHPSTARFVAAKLARRFLGSDPGDEIVQKTARVFEQTRGDLRAVLRVLLLDGLPLRRERYCRPVHFVTAALRILEAETDCGPAVQDALLRMGQLPFNWPTPDGYPDHGDAWQGNLMPRWQFAFALARGEIAGTRIDLSALLAGGEHSPAQILERLSGLLLGAPLPAADGARLLASIQAREISAQDLPSLLTAGLVASPAFQTLR